MTRWKCFHVKQERGEVGSKGVALTDLRIVKPSLTLYMIEETTFNGKYFLGTEQVIY